AQVDLVQLEPVEFVGNRMVGTGQEGGAHAPCFAAQPQVEACRLDLVAVQRTLALEPARLEKCGDVLIGENACLAQKSTPQSGPNVMVPPSFLISGAVDASKSEE